MTTSWFGFRVKICNFFKRKFPRKVTVMHWRHLCEFTTLPTYILVLLHIIPFHIVKKYFVFRSRRKMKKKKIKSKQVFFVFFGHYYHERKYQLSLYPKPELLLPYLCLSFKKQKLSKLQRQKKIIPVK